MLQNVNSKYLNWTVLALLAFLIVLTISGLRRFGNIGQEIYPQRTIMATGEGEAFAVPDIASFSFGATETADTVADAQAKVDGKIAKALEAVKKAGVEEKDIKTIDYSVSPNYEWQQIYCITTPCPPGKNVLKGYQVSQTISIKVRNTEKAGELITAIGGLNLNNVSGIQFTVDDRDKYVAQAREEAIAKAKENAQKMAKELGVRLGKLMYFNDNSGYPVPYAAEGMGGDMRVSAVASQAMNTKAEIPTGENRITANVSLTYEIK
jgi:uncharacterized protein YggE